MTQVDTSVTPKPASTARSTFPSSGLLSVWAIAMFGFLYLPIVVVVLMSLNDSAILALPFKGVTLAWYQQLWSDRALRMALFSSLKVAAAATILATGFGTLAAFAVYRYSFFGKATFRIALNLPILLPGIVTGVAMLAYFSDLGLELSLATVILGHAIFGLPVAFGPILARLTQFPRNLEEAAYDLGARPHQVFFGVIVPYIRSAIIAGALLAFTLSFDEVIVTIFLTGRENTLPMEIWARLRTNITPEIAAAATFISAASAGIVLISQWATREQL